MVYNMKLSPIEYRLVVDWSLIWKDLEEFIWKALMEIYVTLVEIYVYAKNTLLRIIVEVVSPFILKAPISMQDFNIWIAMTAIILLLTSELLSTFKIRGGVMINKRRLRLAAISISVIFLFSISLWIFLDVIA